jgi:uncharacterized protein
MRCTDGHFEGRGYHPPCLRGSIENPAVWDPSRIFADKARVYRVYRSFRLVHEEAHMKYTICVTQRCNLRCEYCYVGKSDVAMSSDVARRIVHFAYDHTPPEERIEIGFFGGEPLLEFHRIRDIVDRVEDHPEFTPERVDMTVVSNGTVFSDEIAHFLLEHAIAYGVSCDGPPLVHDRFRRFIDGRGSGRVVTETLKHAVAAMPGTMVNAVYRPQTLHMLPRVVEYFSELGLRQIYLSPDFSAHWTSYDAASLTGFYSRVGAFHAVSLALGDPHFISLIDAKIAVILRGGYGPNERCRMGRGEFAFSARGFVYPCERLLGSGEGDGHCIGHIETGIDAGRLSCHPAAREESPPACIQCTIRDYCVNGCGCSNFMSTGSYHRPGAFLCASERAAIQAAYDVLVTLDAGRCGPKLIAHFAGESARRSCKTRLAIADLGEEFVSSSGA